MPDLKIRSTEEEIMDDLSDSSPALYQALKELDTINKWLGGNAITINAVKSQILKRPDKKWVIADLGCGSGEMLKKIAIFCRKKNIDFRGIGYDANPNVINYAIKHCQAYPELEFKSENILSEGFSQEKFDMVLCTLFLHHFSEDTLISLIHQLKEQSDQIIINDLHRHWLAYYSIQLLTALFSRSSMVKNDACLSVWRAFKKSELKEILEKAKAQNYQLSWRWAFRWKLIIE